MDRAGVVPGAIDEVILGNANGAGEEHRNVARMATLLAGLPLQIPGVTVNRLCASGMSAITPRTTDEYGEVCRDAVIANQNGEIVARYDVLTLVEKEDTTYAR